MLLNKTPFMDLFERYCIRKNLFPFYNLKQLSAQSGIPIELCEDFQRRLDNVTIDKSVKKRLGRWVFK